MKSIYFIVLLFLTFNQAFCQKRTDGVKIEDRPLRWDDFKGNGGADAYVAHTNYAIEMEPIRIPRDNNTMPVFNINCYFIPKESWVNKDFLAKSEDSTKEYVLLHEQKHYDIARAGVAELNNTLNNYSFDRKRFKAQVDSIFKTISAKIRSTQKRYDDDTNHGIEKEIQYKWNKQVAQYLADGKLPDAND